MIANHLGIELSLEYLLNDEEDIPKQLIGEKMVPILLYDDGSAIGESLDIASYFADSKNVNLALGEHFETVNLWVSKHFDLLLHLTIPRWPMLELPEFATRDAVLYFVEKKEALLGKTFETLLDNSEHLIEKMESAFEELSWVEPGKPLSWQDVNLYPFLRNLTVVKGLNLPDNLKRYTEDLSKRCNIKDFTKLAS